MLDYKNIHRFLEATLFNEELCRHLIQQRKSSLSQSQVTININIEKVPQGQNNHDANCYSL